MREEEGALSSWRPGRGRGCSSSSASARSSASASSSRPGKESDFFIDCKQAVLTAEGHALVGEAMLDALGDLPARATRWPASSSAAARSRAPWR